MVRELMSIVARYSLILAATLVPWTVAAQSYPSKPIRFILPFPPGGPTDLLGRSIAERLTEKMGQPVITENRPGAGGNVGAEAAARATPDGYTIVLCAPSLAISPSLYSKMNYDPQRDLAPVALVATIPNVLVAHPKTNAKTLDELIQVAKANPGKLNFGSGGPGTSNHLAGELLKSLTNTNIVHVPYKGVETALKAMLGGEVDFVVIGIPASARHIQAGSLRGLAILGENRVSALPDVPTAKEAGFGGLEVETWYGILTTASVPREVIAKLNRDLRDVLQSPEMKQRLGTLGIEPTGSSPDEFAAFLKSETARWAKVVKDAGAKVD